MRKIFKYKKILKGQINLCCWAIILNTKMEGRYADLAEFAKVYSAFRQPHNQLPVLYNMTVNPFESSARFYDHTTLISNLWQKYCYLVSKDVEFITQLYTPLLKDDEWIDFLFSIFQASKHINKDSITYVRSDYFECADEGQPKLTEYNLMVVGLSYTSRQFTLCHRLCDHAEASRYFSNNNIDQLINSIVNLYKRKQLKGLFLFLIGEIETTVFQQRFIEIQLRGEGIQCRRVKFEELISCGRVDENNDYRLGEQLVSMAYFRTGFVMSLHKQDLEALRSCRQNLAVSNAISIPPVSMELVNLKRTQIQLSKSHIIRKYLPEEQAKLIELSLVQNWEFENTSEEVFHKLLIRYKQDPNGFVLKPNRQGGCNNHFGVEGYEKLSNLTVDQRRGYILQKFIKPVIHQNENIYRGKEVIKKRCSYELGRFGVICEIDGKLETNVTEGYLVRARGEGQHEDMVSLGTDGIGVWKEAAN